MTSVACTAARGRTRERVAVGAWAEAVGLDPPRGF